jgi:hypothetical protein
MADDIMKPTWHANGRWRRDGLTIVNVPGQTATFFILPNDELQAIIDRSPTSGRPIISLWQARAIADATYPLRQHA